MSRKSDNVACAFILITIPATVIAGIIAGIMVIIKIDAYLATNGLKGVVDAIWCK